MLKNILYTLLTHVSFLLKVRTILVCASIIILFSIGTVTLAKDLPNPSRLITQDRDLSTEIYDRNGILLYRFYTEKNRTLVTLEEIPPYLKQATIAIEDKHFYQHKGIDIGGIIRALRINWKNRELTGGSTITQQLIKNTLLTPEKTFKRKIREIILAFWTEELYTKDQILKMYLNEVAYGGPAWGIRAATQMYFGKEPKDLSLAEASLIAGLPAAPTTYSPLGPDKSLARLRQKEVLRRMTEDKYITRAQADSAYSEELYFATPSAAIVAPHFVMYVRDALIEKYGSRKVYTGGLKVTTTLDVNIQKMAEAIVRDEVQKLEPLMVTNGGAMVTNPKTGEILAMVGSSNYFKSDSGNFNVTTTLRQPGSAIKPVTYAAAFKAGFTPSAIVLDTLTSFPSSGQPTYRPINYDGSWHGPVTLRQALGNSYNIPAVKLLSALGVNEFIKLAKAMGITTLGNDDRYGLSITLGGMEIKMVDMMSLYGILATGGIRHDPASILQVEDPHGKVLEQFKDTGKQILEPEVAFLITDILSDNKARSQAFGFNSPLRIDEQPVAVKTGTSDEKRDNWTFGYTPSIAVGVWVGNNDNKPMHPSLTSGITGAAPIWKQIMLNLLKNKPPEKFERPNNIIEQTTLFGKPCPRKECYGLKDLFIKGKPAKDLVKIQREQLINPDTGEILSEDIRYTDNFSTYATPSGGIRTENAEN